MSDTVDVQAEEVNPLDDKILTLKFTVKQINEMLNAIGGLPFVQAVGIVNAIHSQCIPQVEALKENDESTPAT